jgi:hypothetical protein
MRWIKAVVAEVLALFVDDGAFAVAIFGWLVFAGSLFPYIDVPPWAKGPILFAGLAAIFVESAARRARK